MPSIHPSRRWRPAALTLALGLLLGAAPSVRASIILEAGSGGGNPPENLQFNNPDLVLQGTTVQGETNQTQAVLDISSIISLTGNGGQADVTATSGNAFGGGGVSLTPHSANNLPAGLNPMVSFTALKFNVETFGNGNLLIQAYDGSGTLAASDTFSVSSSGSNFFQATADGSDVITKVVLTSLDSSSTPTDLIHDIQQIRLGGVSVVPEPASLLLGGVALGIGLLGGLRRKRAALKA